MVMLDGFTRIPYNSCAAIPYDRSGATPEHPGFCAMVLPRSSALSEGMTMLSTPVDLHAAPAARAVSPRAPITDDMAMLRATVEQTRDLGTASPLIYWGDLIASAGVGYGGMALAIVTANVWLMLLGSVGAVIGLYRAGSMIHELTHVKHSTLPWFRFGWNALVGVPLLVPSLMYEGVHTLHHARTRYGTAEDPEYLPLALMKPWTVPLFVIVSALAPLALIIRWGVLTPLSLIVPPLRRIVVERYSGLVINPAFRRRAVEGELRRNWIVQEAACSIWAISLVALVVTQTLPLRAFLIGLGIASGVMVLNQLRTLVAHLWENEGEAMSVTAQFLDSVNVPPPGIWAELWAPIGLRYHALHHLLPSLPYHALPEAHRRLAATLAPTSHYHGANYRGLARLVSRLVASTVRVHRAR
jgi:fatty acid desaturase